MTNTSKFSNYCLVTTHNTYKSVTYNYVHPSFLLSYRTRKPNSPGKPSHKLPLQIRNKLIRQLGFSTQWKTFLTLTFNPDNYPPDNQWSDYQQLQKAFRTFTRALKYRYPYLKYLGVLEHGKKSGRKHFHLLTNLPFDLPIFQHFKSKTRKICPLWEEGYSDVTSVNNNNCNAVFYLLKYLEKGDEYRTPIGKREVFASKGLNKKTKKIIHIKNLPRELSGFSYYDTYYSTDVFTKDNALAPPKG